MPIPENLDKPELRRTLRKVRAGVSASLRQRAARALVRHALRNRLLARGKRIGFYLPSNAEINVLPLLLRASAMRVRCYLPVIPQRHQRKLWFSLLHTPLRNIPQSHPHWRANRFGIPEFLPPQSVCVRASRLDRLFVPLLGFDRRGYRLGMGGGFYDASLAFLATRRCWRAPHLVGVAYAAQEVERVPEAAWDVPLDAVLTETGLLRAQRRATQ